MASTTSSSSGFFSTPRGQQRLLWISAGVLVVGIAIFLGVFFSRGSAPASSGNLLTVSTPPATKPHSTKPAAKVKPSAAAYQVARLFLRTAVERKNLDAAYDIVGPYLKGGITRAQWRTGNIPVTFYPAANVNGTQFVVKSSSATQLLLEVVLNPRKGSGVKRPQAFKLGLDRVGGKGGKPAHWVVNYFLPDYKLPIRANPNS